MLELPGIDRDKVRLYGGRYLRLIRDFHKHYENMMRQQEDCPKDPNHETAVYVISDDEDEQQDLHDFVAEDERGESSTYFQPSPEVEAFNARRKIRITVSSRSSANKSIVSQLQSLSPTTAARSQPESRSYKPRKAEGRPRKASHNGYQSGRKASKGESSKARPTEHGKRKGAAACRAGNIGNQFGIPGIGAMPT